MRVRQQVLVQAQLWQPVRVQQQALQFWPEQVPQLALERLEQQRLLLLA